MTSTPQHAIRITTPAAGPLSRARKQFNTLVKKLETERVRLAFWHTEAPKIRAMADNEFNPLFDQFASRRRELVRLLDRAWHDKALSKRDREKLADFICSMALAAVEADQDDDDIKAIYNRYSQSDFDEEADAENAVFRAMVKQATGVELDADTDLDSAHAFFEAMHEKMEAADAQRAEPAKPAKPSARALRHEAEEAKLKQSVRDIFRKLASALHPDRETDPAERARKTDLMQRANVAYGANDLLGLLELQLEVEQVDQAGLDNLGDDKIEQYNGVLARQVREIHMEIQALEFHLALDMGWEPDERRTPKALMRQLRQDIAAMKANVKAVEADLVEFGDIRKLKAWLKGYRIVKDEGPWF